MFEHALLCDMEKGFDLGVAHDGSDYLPIARS